MSDLKALVVDFGGVLTTPLQESFQKFSDEHGVELEDLVRALLPLYTGAEDALVHAYETGAMSDEEFAGKLAERLTGALGRPIDSEGLLVSLFQGMALDEVMVDAVDRVRQAGLKTGLVSNSWGLEFYPRRRFGEIFDVMVISAEVGLRKPDPAIFELACERLGVPPEECVFVDDFGGHLKAAAALGMTTVLHRSAEITIKELESLLGTSLS